MAETPAALQPEGLPGELLVHLVQPALQAL